MTQPKLKPCHHCEGTNLQIKFMGRDADEWPVDFYIQCQDCDYESCDYESEKIAIYEWNHRPREDKLLMLLKEARKEICDDMFEWNNYKNWCNEVDRILGEGEE